MAKVPPRRVPDKVNKYIGLTHCIAAFFSKDPYTQVAACLTDADGGFLGLGYNGPPPQFKDDELDWSRSGGKNNSVIHAEINSMRWARRRGSLKGAIMYVSAMPCNPCILEMAAEGIKKVIYFPLKSDKDSMLSDPKKIELAKDTAKKGNIELLEFKGNLNWIRDKIKELDKKGIFG